MIKLSISNFERPSLNSVTTTPLLVPAPQNDTYVHRHERVGVPACTCLYLRVPACTSVYLSVHACTYIAMIRTQKG